ncbi:hypothetical protein N0V93_010155 [Gnomoniopsis smithogilvyi]|uniref:Uncharacterized protein n=1 Tax=Gnomoniopsis smithogilvyi TaxID=1191159 RepID=A0A9W8YKN7_9PEZI|nr:hypothetical protein N0V93_010155 [Gnomoniopsis smithogilvyi]
MPVCECADCRYWRDQGRAYHELCPEFLDFCYGAAAVINDPTASSDALADVAARILGEVPDMIQSVFDNPISGPFQLPLLQELEDWAIFVSPSSPGPYIPQESTFSDDWVPSLRGGGGDYDSASEQSDDSEQSSELIQDAEEPSALETGAEDSSTVNVSAPEPVALDLDAANVSEDESPTLISAKDVAKETEENPWDWVTKVGPWVNEEEARLGLANHLQKLALASNKDFTSLVASWTNAILILRTGQSSSSIDNELCEPNINALLALNAQVNAVTAGKGLKRNFTAAESGFLMVDGVDSGETTYKFNTVLMVNGDLYGNPDARALSSGACTASDDSLTFSTHFVLPEISRSSVNIEIGYLKTSSGQADAGTFVGDPYITVIGHINLAFKNARAHEPIWEALDPKDLAKRLGVDKCAPMWQLTFTGKPNIYLEDVGSLKVASETRKLEFARLEQVLKSKADVKITIITPRFDPDPIPLVREDIDEAWLRDGDEPLKSFLEASKYKHVVNLDTIAPPDKTPYQKAVLSVINFTDLTQYAVTMAYGNQAEFLFQQDQIQDLAESTGMTGTFIMDTGYIHPESRVPWVYLFWLKATPSQIPLLPKVGQSGYIILPQVKKLNHPITAEELAANARSETQLIVDAIKNISVTYQKDSRSDEARLNFFEEQLALLHHEDDKFTGPKELAPILIVLSGSDRDEEALIASFTAVVNEHKWLSPPPIKDLKDLNEDPEEPVHLSFVRVADHGS